VITIGTSQDDWLKVKFFYELQRWNRQEICLYAM